MSLLDKVKWHRSDDSEGPPRRYVLGDMSNGLMRGIIAATYINHDKHWYWWALDMKEGRGIKLTAEEAMTAAEEFIKQNETTTDESGALEGEIHKAKRRSRK